MPRFFVIKQEIHQKVVQVEAANELDAKLRVRDGRTIRDMGRPNYVGDISPDKWLVYDENRYRSITGRGDYGESDTEETDEDEQD